MSKVMYIKYQGNKRTTIAADTQVQGLVIKMDTVKPILAQVVESIDTDVEYNDYLTQRMLDKIHINHMKNKQW